MPGHLGTVLTPKIEHVYEAVSDLEISLNLVDEINISISSGHSVLIHCLLRRWTSIQMSVWGLWPSIHNLQHPQGTHQDSHWWETLCVQCQRLYEVFCISHQLQKPHTNTHRWGNSVLAKEAGYILSFILSKVYRPLISKWICAYFDSKLDCSFFFQGQLMKSSLWFR